MNILAIDTTTDACSVALAVGESVFHRFEIAPRQHTQKIFDMMQACFDEAHLEKQDCDAIAFTHGPGSFTGVRIACSVAHALAVALNRPLIPITSLQALAQQAFRLWQAPAAIAALDARMNEYYWAEYRVPANQSHMMLVGEEHLSKAEDIRYDSNDPKLHAIGQGWQSLTTVLPTVHPHALPDALDVLSLAKMDYARGRLLTPEEAQPLYLRNQVVRKPHG